MRRKQAAFTLVEAIVAMGILSMVLVMVYQTFYSVLQTTKIGADATEQVQRERIVLKTIEDALSGVVYYEQNQEHYAFVADTLDFNYPSISFVSRVPPDFLGSKEFGAQSLRRVEFVVEDAPVEVEVEVNGKTIREIRDERALVMYQTPILLPIDATELEEPKRWVLGPGLDTFMVMFWSTINSEWLPDWEETNSVPTRLKIEIAFKLNDGSAAQLADLHKREIVIFSDTITQAMQNPKMPASKSRGSRGRSGRGDSRSGARRPTPKPTAEQMKRIADWRKQQEQREHARKRDSGKRQYSEAEKAAYRKRMAERYAKYAKAKQAVSGGFRFTPPGGSNKSGGAPPSGGVPPSGGGGGSPGLSPGSIPINEALELYESTFGQQAETLQDLVDTGVLTSEELGHMQSTAPTGAEWGIDPRTGLVTAVYP